MSETKRTKGSSTRRAARGGAVAVLEQEQAAVPLVDGLDDFDDILGEIAPPPKAEPADGFDDILSEITGPAAAEPADGFDDILSEIAGPAAAEPADGFDDILSEIAGPAAIEPADGLDDILSEIAGPAKAEPADSLEDILGEVAGPVPVAAAAEAKAKAPRKQAASAEPAEEDDDLSAMLDEMTPSAPAEAAAASAETPKRPGIIAKVAGLAGSVLSLVQGTRQISRKAYFGLLGTIGLLGLTTLGQAAFIVLRPAEAPSAGHGPAANGGHAPVAAIPLIPVDYSKIDLSRYRDKVRALGEGGRDMLRNPAIKEAILQLDNGEEIYDELVKLSRLSKAADLVSIGEDRLTINSCNLAACADKSFKLVYDLQHENATVCMTEKYLNGSYLSYSYGPEGYREEPSCNGAAPPAPPAPTSVEHDPGAAEPVGEDMDHAAEGPAEGEHAAEH